VRAASPKVEAGFVSFTEVEAGEHRSYNEWHVFDHLPEQLPLAGVAWGQRWVLTPGLPSTRTPPLDRVHYLTLYLMAAPVQETIDVFFRLADELRALDRFHLHRTAHLAGALAVTATYAAPRALVSAEAIPYRPNRGVHVRVEPRDQPGGASAAELVAVPGVAGAWELSGDAPYASRSTRDQRITWCWLDASADGVAARLHDLPAAPGATFVATAEAVDPWGSWGWFD
jgi:hypothetical protein